LGAWLVRLSFLLTLCLLTRGIRPRLQRDSAIPAMRPCRSELSHADCLRTQHLKLSTGDAVMLGSLDRTAGRHQVTLRWFPADAHSEACVVMSGSTHAGSYATRLQISPARGCDVTTSDWSIVWADASAETDCTADCEDFPGSTVNGKSTDTENCLPPTLVRKTDAVDVRRFAVPLFTADGVRDRHLVAHEIACGDQVRVYATDRNDSSSSLAIAVVERLERRLIQFVGSRVGALSDVDRDGYLTVVLSQLETRESASTACEPVRGCVRASDVFAPGEFGGDIIYLSDSVPVDDELDAILAHELTHLAVFSGLCSVGRFAQLPGWLNEAVAHHVERQVSPRSRNLATRLEQFRRRPAEFPVVVPDHHASLSLRRGPSRAAGCLFLNSVLSRLPEHAIGDLIAGSGGAIQRLEQLTGRTFADLFRDWGLQMIASGNNLPRWQVIDGPACAQQLTGTALSWSEPVITDGILAITSSADCQLQVTVLSGDGLRPDSARR